MTIDKTWHTMMAFAPLALIFADVGHPWGRVNFVLKASFWALAIWSAWSNPLRGRPASTLALCLGYLVLPLPP
jgi:hypothetical protein